MEVQHAEICCTNKECPVGYHHGYHISNESVIYDSDALSKEILFVSRRTGFEVLYLYEAVMGGSTADARQNGSLKSSSEEIERFKSNPTRHRGFLIFVENNLGTKCAFQFCPRL